MGFELLKIVIWSEVVSEVVSEVMRQLGYAPHEQSLLEVGRDLMHIKRWNVGGDRTPSFYRGG